MTSPCSTTSTWTATTAQALIDAGVVAVVNAGPMISGRYPNLGPELLVEAGVTVVDNAGPEVFDRLKDGTEVRIDAGVVHAGDDAGRRRRARSPPTSSAPRWARPAAG